MPNSNSSHSVSGRLVEHCETGFRIQHAQTLVTGDVCPGVLLLPL